MTKTLKPKVAPRLKIKVDTRRSMLLGCCNRLLVKKNISNRVFSHFACGIKWFSHYGIHFELSTIFRSKYRIGIIELRPIMRILESGAFLEVTSSNPACRCWPGFTSIGISIDGIGLIKPVQAVNHHSYPDQPESQIFDLYNNSLIC